MIQAGRTCAEMFEQMDDPYLRERGADMMDISTRVAACLAGQEYPCRMDDEAAVIIRRFGVFPRFNSGEGDWRTCVDRLQRAT